MPIDPLPIALIGIFLLFFFLIVLIVFFRKRSSQTVDQTLLRESFNRLEEMARKLDDLGRIFLLPRTRGGIGETLLEQLLGNWLPAAAWRRQYRFSDGGRVDAVIRAGSFLVPIDSKFPLERVAGLLKDDTTGEDRRIPPAERKVFTAYAREISEKYIRPEEGTLQFALLYLPSEHIYYRCFVEDPSLSEELLSFHVVPVGPSALFLYLQTVAYGLKGLSLPQKAKELRSHIQRIKSETERLERLFSTSSTHLKNLQASFDDSRTALARLSTTSHRLGDDNTEASEKE